MLPHTPRRPTPRLRLAHLSDLHVTGDGSPVGGTVDTRARVREALAVLTSWRLRVDAWVFSGDLSDDGSLASYAWLRRHVSAAADALGVAVVWGTGNHDDTAAFRAGLGLGGSGPVDTETTLGGVRVLTVDSAGPGGPEGTIGPESLAWLTERLGSPAPGGSVLVVHHNPLPQPQDAAAWLWPLTNPEELAGVVRGSDVRLILSGHFHQTGSGTLAGVPVAMATSLAYGQDVGVSPDLRGQDTPVGFNLVELYARDVVVTAVPLGRAPGVHAAVSSSEARARAASGPGPAEQ